MLFTRDPDGKQSVAIIAIADFKDKNVVEIGCGDGFLTCSYAHHVGHVTAIDPSVEDIEAAIMSTPPYLADKVEFIVADIRDFTPEHRKSPYDIALFAWSL
ncbi:MAG TPA: class I SAM-dependent methyltransferase [candidate division Zixibacteria bacterium]|nr:class I SAM-dependent methyltransferase [candidate division Zixibacteria bacterium]